ncbi:MAG: hypothetical protein AMXMBFR25_10640 [Lysobacterales bacterium]
MYGRMLKALGRQAPMWFRIVAVSGTLLLHLWVIDRLLAGTEVLPGVRTLRPLTVDVALIEPGPPQTEPAPEPPSPPPSPPLVPPLPPPAARVVETLRRPSVAITTPSPPVPATPVERKPAPLADLEAQREAIAAEIARERAPARRAFAGRSLDAMLPDAETGILPGLRPRTHDGAREWGRRLGALLQGGLPQAAVDPEAPLDPLTDRWEQAHHGSDLATCERQYEELDHEMRRMLCGEARPPR